MRIILSCLLFILVFNLHSCNKEEKADFSANNTFLTFKLNGEVWNSSRSNEFLFLDGEDITGLFAIHNSDYNTFDLIATKFSDTSILYISINLTQNLIGTYSGETLIGADYFNGILYKHKSGDFLDKNGDFSYKITYSINITKFDLTNNLVSGTFTASIRDPLSRNTMGEFDLTDGSFTDVKLIVN